MGAPFLLDTNVLVALLRQNELGRRINAAHNLTATLGSAMISVVTIGEMKSLVRQWNWGADKVTQVSDLLQEVVTIDINNETVLTNYGEIDSYSVKNGKSIGRNDVWIAATCMAAGAVLLTTDRDFDPLEGRFIQRVFIDPKAE